MSHSTLAAASVSPYDDSSSASTSSSPFALTLIRFAGLHSLSISIFHIFFWRLFRWSRTLQKCNELDRGVLQILNIKLILVLGALAYGCLFETSEMHRTRIGKGILGVSTFFWITRIIEQWIFLPGTVNDPKVRALLVYFASAIPLFATPLFLK